MDSLSALLDDDPQAPDWLMLSDEQLLRGRFALRRTPGWGTPHQLLVEGNPVGFYQGGALIRSEWLALAVAEINDELRFAVVSLMRRENGARACDTRLLHHTDSLADAVRFANAHRLWEAKEPLALADARAACRTASDRAQGESA